MAIRLGEHYIWTGTDWDLYYMKTRADNVQEVVTGDGKLFLTLSERNKIAGYLATFNVADALVQLGPDGKFSNELIKYDKNITSALAMDIGTVGTINFYQDAEIDSIKSQGDFSISTLNGNVNGNPVDISIASSSDIYLKTATNKKVYIDNPLYFNGDTWSKKSIENIGGIHWHGNNSAWMGFNSDTNTTFISWDEDTKEVSFSGTTVNFGSGPQNLRLKGLKDPEDATDAATKQWVEQLVAQGTHVVAAVRAASTGNISTLSGVGTSVDGVTLAAKDRILLKNQTTASQNGVYIVETTGWTKIPNDSDKGSLAFVLEGTTNKGTQYYNSNGTAWNIFFIQDTYYVTEGKGLVLDDTGFGFGIADNGVTNAMLAGSISAGKILKSSALTADGNNLTIAEGGITNDMLAGSIDWGKLANTATNDGLGAWGNLSAPNTAQPLSTKINQLFSAIKNLRGTTNYNTNNAQTISGAYTLAGGKSLTTMGTTVPPSGYTGNAGDTYIRQVS